MSVNAISFSGEFAIEELKIVTPAGQVADLISDVLVIEKVTRPASLVRCMGLFEGIGAALELETHTVRPQEWKKYYGLSKNKQESIDLALEHYPSLDSEITKISDDGIAEAVLIAEYGYVIDG